MCKWRLCRASVCVQVEVVQGLSVCVGGGCVGPECVYVEVVQGLSVCMEMEVV